MSPGCWILARKAASYEIPFIDRVRMNHRFARWLARLSDPPNQELIEEPEIDGGVTWNYQRHGWLPWMEFFYDWRFADITGDGKIDMALTCGAFRQITYRQNGSEIWRYEDAGASCLDIRMDSNFPVFDIDGDGVTELVCPRRVHGDLHLCIVDARTGILRKSISYPDREKMPENPQGGHFRSSVFIINATGGKRPSDILVGWDYRSVTLLDRDLNILWNVQIDHHPDRKHRTMGHSPHFADIDGDGCDEIFAGSVLLDHDGSVMTVLPDLPALLRDGHADSVRISHIGGKPVLLMSTGAYCFDIGGNPIWGRDEIKHGQALRIGKIRGDIPDQQFVIYEGASRVEPGKPDRVIALDSHGELLWKHEVRQPNMQEGGFGFWLGDWNGDGLDEVFVNDPECVRILDGHGRIIDTIKGHLVYVFDLLGDARAEAITLDGIGPGMSLDIVTNDRPNPHPSTNTLIEKRKITKEMCNSTRY